MTPPLLALFEKRFEGDDALMALLRLRFQQAQLGAEIHGGTVEHLEAILQFRPSPAAPVVIHLPRHFNLTDASSRQQIVVLATHFAGRVRGMVLHDHPDLAARPRDYRAAARQLEAVLAGIRQSPLLFIEYAACLEPAVFAEFFASIGGSPCLGPCIDTGHVGIRQVRAAYAQRHPKEDICALKSDPARLPPLIEEIDDVLRSALPAVLGLVKELGELGQPMHFHLHDGHPLSTFSPFGVSDHLSFSARIPITFEHAGQRTLPLMYGPAGLAQIRAQAMQSVDSARLSFTLEIHPTGEQLDLADAAPLFRHWRDQTHARQTNHWLSILQQNRELFLR